MQIGIDEGYEPIQPIHFSHKIHAGDNQIDCKYCHSGARTSAVAGVPSLNVCMGCHNTISEYEGEEDTANGYTKEFYTKEIKKLYEAVGWDEQKFRYTGTSKPVQWIRNSGWVGMSEMPRRSTTNGGGTPARASYDGVVYRVPPPNACEC